MYKTGLCGTYPMLKGILNKGYEYHWGDHYCLYSNLNGTSRINEKGEIPYKTKDGKYILIEVKE